MGKRYTNWGDGEPSTVGIYVVVSAHHGKWRNVAGPVNRGLENRYICQASKQINRDYYQSVFGYRQYHVLGIKIVLCEPLASIIHYFLFPIHDTADTQRHEGNNLFII